MERDELERLRAVAEAGVALPASAVRRLLDHIARVERDRDRLADWLVRIEGGDRPCLDDETLRRWAYEALTLGKECPE